MTTASVDCCCDCRAVFDGTLPHRRRLTDSCGHQRCYACVRRSSQCPACVPTCVPTCDPTSVPAFAAVATARSSGHSSGNVDRNIVNNVYSNYDENGLSSYVKKVTVQARVCSAGNGRSCSVSHQVHHSPATRHTPSCRSPPLPSLRSKLKTNAHLASLLQWKGRRSSESVACSSTSPAPASIATTSSIFSTSPRDKSHTHPPLPPSATARRTETSVNGVCSRRRLASPRMMRVTSRCHDNAKTSSAVVERSPSATHDWDAAGPGDDRALYTRLGLLLGRRVVDDQCVDDQSSTVGVDDICPSLPRHSSLHVGTKQDSASPVSTLTASSSGVRDAAGDHNGADSLGSFSSLTLVSLTSGSTYRLDEPSVATTPSSLRTSRERQLGDLHIGADNSGAQTGSVSLDGAVDDMSSCLLKSQHQQQQQQDARDSLHGARTCFVRRSARCQRVTPPVPDKVRLSQFREAPLSLRPLFFEVPRLEDDSLFLGRHWLFGRLAERVAADKCCPLAAGGGGMLITGSAGTGKTALLLQLVEYSCFGRRWGCDDASPDIRRLAGVSGGGSRGGMVHQEALSPEDPCTVSSQLKMLGNRVVAYHFCQAGNVDTCCVAEFVHSLAAQLSRSHLLLPYRRLLQRTPSLQQLLAHDACSRRPAAALVDAIWRPLQQLTEQGLIDGATCLVLVDALDQAQQMQPGHGDSLAAFLAAHASQMPGWLQLVATCRVGCVAVTQLQPWLRRVCLDRLLASDEVAADLAGYVHFRCCHSPSIRAGIQVSSATTDSKIASASGGLNGGGILGRFVAHVTQLSRGSLLYLRLLLDLIERGHLVMKAAGFRVLPRTLAELYRLTFSIKFRSGRAFNVAVPVLAVCLASERPPDIYRLFHCVNAARVRRPLDWADFVRHFRSVAAGLLARRADGTYMFADTAVREWLTRRRRCEPPDDGRFVVDARVGHRLLALMISRRLSTQQPSPPPAQAVHAPLSADDTLQLALHVVDAQMFQPSSATSPDQLQNASSTYLSSQKQTDAVSEDAAPCQEALRLQAAWLAAACCDVSGALVCDAHCDRLHVAAASLLLAAGAAVDARCARADGGTLLSVAASAGDEAMTRLLVCAGASVDAAAERGVTPLMRAAAAGHSCVARLLMTAGADLTAQDASGRCAVTHAALAGRLCVVEQLVWADWERWSASLRLQAAQRALVAAAGGGHVRLLEVLLDAVQETPAEAAAAVGVDCVDSTCGHTALTMAAAAGRGHVLDVLLRRGADLSAVNGCGGTALHSAAAAATDGEAQAAVCAAVLRRAPALIDVRDDAGRTALMVAAGHGNARLTQLFLAHDASVTLVDRDGLTVLCWACLRGHAATAALLLDDASTDVNVEDTAGRTPLDLAAFYGDTALVTMLLERGAVMEHVDARGMRPLDRAVGCSNLATVHCFLSRGAKLANSTWLMAADKPQMLFALLNKLNDDGMILYRKYRVLEAQHRFSYALKNFPEQQQQLGEDDHIFRRLRVNLLLNLSRCKRKLGDLEKSIELATLAMSVRPEAFEPYFFRAKARHAQTDATAAVADLDTAIRLAPASRQLRQTMARLRDNIDAAAAATEAAHDPAPIYTSIEPVFTEL